MKVSLSMIFGSKYNFQIKLRKFARKCALDNAHIQNEWGKMLYEILDNWHANVIISNVEAVDYMMSICGYDALGNCTMNSCESAFWFLQSEQYKNLGVDDSNNKRLYSITIALFEPINYWCWHESPIPITFDYDGLKDVLKHGSISIDWDIYND